MRKIQKYMKLDTTNQKIQGGKYAQVCGKKIIDDDSGFARNYDSGIPDASSDSR